jgi:signal transduction histidine kinase
MCCVKHLITWLLGILAVASAGAEDFTPNLQQLNHRGFTRLEGAPTYAYTIAQTTRTLRISTAIEGDSIKLLVRDSGVGLDPHGIEKLFEAFHTTKAHGLGIGLAISRSIIESHKGKLCAMANNGPGATLGLSIPSP